MSKQSYPFIAKSTHVIPLSPFRRLLDSMSTLLKKVADIQPWIDTWSFSVPNALIA